MKANDPTTLGTPPAELELDLQEALARRQRAADLFGAPDWEDELETDQDDFEE